MNFFLHITVESQIEASLVFNFRNFGAVLHSSLCQC